MKHKHWTRIQITTLFAAFIILSAGLLSCSPNGHTPDSAPPKQGPVEPATKRFNNVEAMKKPYVIMVSLDGFRHDYIEKFEAKNLAEIERMGRRTDRLMPSFPSKTFPNHYTLVTGMLPSTHGIIDNNFYNPDTKEFYSLSDTSVHGSVRNGKWYGGEPLWVAAENSGMVSASYFWVGSEADVKGVRPSFYFNYDDSHPNLARVDKVMEWLALPEAERPHMITVYFDDVDSAAHSYGVNSAETAKAAEELDAVIGELRRRLSETNLNYNLIVVSDHGMADIVPEKIIDLNGAIDFAKFTVVGSGSMISLHSTNQDDLDEAYKVLKKVVKNGDVYWRDDIPKKYQLNGTHLVGNIVVIADTPYYIVTKPIKNPARPAGNLATHGWDNTHPDMGGIFLAEGTNILPGKRLKAFQNIHVYPLVMKILDLQTKEKIDGDFKTLESIYRE